MNRNEIEQTSKTLGTTLVERTAQARLPTRHGEFVAHVYRSLDDGTEHVALAMGELRDQQAVLVRIHSECLTGDILGSLRCDCGDQLEQAMTAIAKAGQGVVVYLRGHEGRGIGLTHKMHAYCLQDQGHDTVDANLELGLPVDSRNYDIGVEILHDLGVRTLRLLSNNPHKVVELENGRLKVVERIPLLVAPNPENINYLLTKQRRLGHQLGLVDALTQVE